MYMVLSVITSSQIYLKIQSSSEVLPIVYNPQDQIGRSFLMEEQPDGQKARGQIVQLIEDHESSLEDNPTRINLGYL
jgi:hypothetical protein